MGMITAGGLTVILPIATASLQRQPLRSTTGIFLPYMYSPLKDAECSTCHKYILYEICEH